MLEILITWEAAKFTKTTPKKHSDSLAALHLQKVPEIYETASTGAYSGSPPPTN